MDSIVLLNPSDIISESMHKINYNFQVIASNEDITDYKLEQLSKQIRGELDDVLIDVTGKEINIMRGMDSLNNRISELPTLDKLQNAIDIAITNASDDLEEFVVRTAGQQISKSLSAYAKTSQIDEKIQNYISSSAFTQYESNAAKRTASMTSVVGNSKFLKTAEGYLVYLDGSTSPYKTIEAFYASLTGSDKQYVDGNSTAQRKLEDPDVVARLVTLCEQRFKTVATELATIALVVDGIEGISSTSIVNMVKENADGSGRDIVAAIFAEANRRDGSSIYLKADHLQLNGSSLKIDTDNFKVNVNPSKPGEVYVKGNIVADSLTIKGGWDLTDSASAAAFIQSLIGEGGEGGEGGGTTPTPSPDNDYSWLLDAFKEFKDSGGVALTGNIFALDSSSNVTAGMMGAKPNSYNPDPIKFFAGTSVAIDDSSFSNEVKNAPFRVLNSGKLYATDAEITGIITAKSLSIKDGNEYKNLKNFVLGIGASEHWGENSGDPSDGDDTDDSAWLRGAFQELSTPANGVLMGGNLLVGDSEANVTAGMLGAKVPTGQTKTLRFFAGANVANAERDADFKVYSDGTLIATKATISGDITAQGVNSISSTGMSTIINNGNLKIYKGSSSNSSNLRAEFGLDGDSVVLKFYDNTGTLLYDLGPNGITHEGETVYPPDWMRYVFKPLSTLYQVNDTFDYEAIVATAIGFYQYTDGTKFKYNGDIEYYNPSTKSYTSSHSSFHNKWFTTNTASDRNLVKSSSGTIYYYANPDKWDQRSTSDTTIVGVIIATTSGHRQGSITLDNTGTVIATNYS